MIGDNVFIESYLNSLVSQIQNYDNMRIFQATSLHIDQLVELFDAYRVWYRKPS